ncbi:MAG: hypothetical protein U0414_24040 [Polyangiaceae bacterium]
MSSAARIALCAVFFAACDPADIPIGSNLGPGGASSGALSSSASSGGGSTGASSIMGCEPGAPRVWTDITPPGVDLTVPNSYGVRAVTLDPADPAVVFVTADFQGLWRSADCGAHWSKLNTGTNGDAIDAGAAWTLAIDPVDHAIYTVSSLGAFGIWKSVDGGVDWAPLFGPGNVTEPVNPFGSSPDIFDIAIDPAQHLHLIASFHGAWKGSSDGGILESSDGGATWSLHAPAPGMGTNHVLAFLDSSTRWLLVNETDGAWITVDGGATFVKRSSNHHVVGGGQVYRSADGTFYHTGAFGLFRSTNLGQDWLTIPSGNTQGLVGDGATLFASDGVAWIGQFYGDVYNPMTSAPESPGDSGWAPWGSQTFDNGANRLAIDPGRHLLYASSYRVGLQRVSTE